MTTTLLAHLRDDVFCSLGPRTAVPDPALRANPDALRASVGVFALRDVTAGSVLDRSIEAVDSSNNFFRPPGIGGLSLLPGPLAEINARCTHSGALVLPLYGLNIFRLLSFVKQGEEPNCAFVDASLCTKDDSSSTDSSTVAVVRVHVTRSKRSGRKSKMKTVKKRKLYGPMFKSLIATRLILKGEELLLPLHLDNALLSDGMEKKSTWTPAEKRLLDHLQTNLFCALGACQYGVGVYAIRAISKGTMVDQTLGTFDDQCNTVTLPWTSIEAAQVPPAVQDQLKKHYQTDEGGLIQIPRYGFNLSRLVSYINHASEGNCDFKFLKRKGYAYIFTTRDIQPGEELCINYHLYLSEEQKLLPMFAFLRDEVKESAAGPT